MCVRRHSRTVTFELGQPSYKDIGPVFSRRPETPNFQATAKQLGLKIKSIVKPKKKPSYISVRAERVLPLIEKNAQLLRKADVSIFGGAERKKWSGGCWWWWCLLPDTTNPSRQLPDDRHPFPLFQSLVYPPPAHAQRTPRRAAPLPASTAHRTLEPHWRNRDTLGELAELREGKEN